MRYFLAAVAAFLFSVNALAASTASITASWTLPTTRENGSALVAGDLSKTTVTYIDTTVGGPGTSVDVAAPGTSVTVTVDTCKTYAFSAYVTDKNGSKSASSQTITVNACRPSAPTLIGFTIN